MHVQPVPALDDSARSAVQALRHSCQVADRTSPLNEAAVLALGRRSGDGLQHWLLRDDHGQVLGYAQAEWIDPATDGEHPSTAQLCVHPEHRRRGGGTRLLSAVRDAHTSRGNGGTLGFWAFGRLPAAAELALREGLESSRELLMMGRDLLTSPVTDEPEVPAGVTLRSFRPGEDEAGWLAVNARAFAHHPEQGRITADDLAARMAEPWFRPQDFLVAERDGQLVGYHWMKAEGELGEVYVIGVDPDAAGSGLGRALLTTGLRHLAEQGCTRVVLYVEADQQRVVRMYHSASFVTVHRDVLYVAGHPADQETSMSTDQAAPAPPATPGTDPAPQPAAPQAPGPQAPAPTRDDAAPDRPATVSDTLLPEPPVEPGGMDDEEFAAALAALPADRFADRELSWLAFNQRVLELADDEQRIPLLERARFLAIFSSNLDEYYMVRVAGLKRRIAAGVAVAGRSGLLPRELHDAILTRTAELVAEQARIFQDEVRPAMAAEGIQILPWSDLTDPEKAAMRRLFAERIFPVLTPLAVDPSHPFPYISGLSVNLAVLLKNPHTGARQFARVKVPTILPRFLDLGGTRFVAIEDVIARHLDQIFGGMQVLEWTTFRVTRNEDLEVEEDDAENLLFALEKELLRRKVGRPPVRLEVQEDTDPAILELLASELDISEREIFTVPAPLDLRGLFTLADIDREDLKYPAFLPSTHPHLAEVETARPADMFAALKQRDVLLHHPYDSFATSVQRFVEQAAADPHVLAIKQTLYRTSGDSPIIDALVEAAQAGKQVLALVEIKARFDEQANIRWARTLEEAGVHVVYGVMGLKTHCKLSMVVREEPDGLRRYAHIGTGNYNPKTARLYEDMGLLTSNPVVTEDVARLFNHLSGMTQETRYRRLLVAPHGIRTGLIDLIRGEIDHHRAGRPAGIRIKVNSAVDEDVLDALYVASQQGVPVDLWVRGICTLRPQVPGLSDNVRVRSILGRFLEHSRLFAFTGGGRPVVGIGSADLMHRNLDRRVEVLTSISNKAHVAEIEALFAQAFAEDTVAWHLDADGLWTAHTTAADGSPLVDMQQHLIGAKSKRRAK